MNQRSDIVEQFAISQRIVRDGIEVVPRFTVFCHDGPHIAFIQLPADLDERVQRLNVMYRFMIWKAAHAFTLASELETPDALMVVAVTRDDAIGAIQPILRNPIGFE